MKHFNILMLQTEGIMYEIYECTYFIQSREIFVLEMTSLENTNELKMLFLKTGLKNF